MLRDLIADFAGKYLRVVASNQKLISGTDADIIKNQIPATLIQLASISNKYKVYGSNGQGNWAEIPWVVILDKEITESTKYGYGVGLLFSADLTSVSLVFGLGWDQFEEKYGIKEGRYRAINTVRFILSQLKTSTPDFTRGNVPLKATTNTGKGYEATSILYKTYQIKNLPDDSAIIDDIRNLIGLYKEVKGLIGRDVFSVDFTATEQLPNISGEPIPEFITNFKLSPPSATNKTPISKEIDVKVDFDEVHKRNTKTGQKGEELVLKNQIDYLKKIGRNDLADKVKLVSDNFSKGYDILSFSHDGKEKYIEVKSTLNKFTGSINFYISRNEKQVAENLDNYYLYFVFDVASNKPKIVSIKGLFKNDQLYIIEPVSYRVRIEGAPQT